MRLARAVGSSVLGVCLLGGDPSLAIARVAGDVDLGPSQASEPDARAAAKAAFARGRQAAAAGDYEVALEGFEEARALDPTPGIHYNIAVCHHRLMLQASEGSADYEVRREHAIEAYNLYLRAAPDADDRAEVEDLIVSLGGHPITRERWTIQRLDPDPTPHPSPELREADPDEPAGEDGDAADAIAPPPKPPPRPTGPWLPRARVGPAFVLMISNMRQLSREPEIATLPMLGLAVRGGAFVGARRRINLGGELALAGQPTGTSARHRLGAGHLGFTFDHGTPLGKKRRFEIGVGALVALAGQSLRHKGVSSVTCPTSLDTEGDREISQRGGLLLGGRLTLALLLGPRRNHELALRITPGLGLFARGTKGRRTAAGDACDDLSTPFEELGMDRPALVTTVDLGYAPRF